MDEKVEIIIMDKDTFTADDLVASVVLTVSRLVKVPRMKQLYQL